MKACACAKHFAAHSGPESGRFRFGVSVSVRDLREYYLPAFRMLVEDAGVETIMSAYNAVNGVPMTANKWLLTDVLRGEWGFGGCVVSDAGATVYLVDGHHIGTPVEAVALERVDVGAFDELVSLLHRRLLARECSSAALLHVRGDDDASQEAQQHSEQDDALRRTLVLVS